LTCSFNGPTCGPSRSTASDTLISSLETRARASADRLTVGPALASDIMPASAQARHARTAFNESVLVIGDLLAATMP
jgi:hypothetical protein